ncbi:MAG: hypothetical protein JNK72_14635 [Myxococcales bacterium]|nr:hypothetical protein [Myxococcales bacterium]
MKSQMFRAIAAALCAAAMGCSSGGSSNATPDAGGSFDVAVDTPPSCTGATMLCGGGCVDPQMSAQHCGGCGNACASGEVCSAGRCQLQCGAGLTECRGGGADAGASAQRMCANLSIDPGNCGMCGNACAAGQRCVSGSCQLSCGGGTTECAGSCRDLRGDNANCGACGRACAAGQVCSQGECRLNCGGGTTMCGDACRDLQTDRANCGACGNSCMPGQVCSMGACRVDCAAGSTNCSGMCRDLQTDQANCGMCGTACAAGQSCVAGTCTVRCAEGQTACMGACRDLQTDRGHCGTCGQACASGEVCTAGRCVATCGAGLSECGGSCRNTATDPEHCGMCGTACATRANASRFCASGACGFTCNAGFGDCNRDAADGCEAPLNSVNNCGGCGVVCAFANAAATCSGTCRMGACNAGFADCNTNPADGCETNVGADSANCGACGRACGAGQVCSAGSCVANCGSGLSNCSGACVNTSFDPNHCNGCGVSCPAAPANGLRFCATGVCGTACRAGFGDCDGNGGNGCETNVTGSLAHCGACNRACAAAPNATPSCSNGTCQYLCATGFSDCDNNASNGCESNLGSSAANCGRCGNVCAQNQVCVNGACTTGTGFSTDWVLQRNTLGQYTRCGSVSVNGNQWTCNLPEVRYGSVEGGIPYQHSGNEYTVWCQQLGFNSFVSGSDRYTTRDVTAPRGRLFGCRSYDETNWHWCDWQDGPWFNQRLDYHQTDTTGLSSITCSF